MRAYILVDLGFGDAGKGLMTDFLVRHFKAGVVVRYNGGAQAGHNVVAPDGRHHTFSQFGSGTFVPGVRTYLSRHVVIHPGALLVEGDILMKRGVRDVFSRLQISEQALVITPFHQAANRIRELVRGAGRHGSCGVGVGEAVEDALMHAENRVLAGDLNNPAVLRKKLFFIREQKREQIAGLLGDHSSDDQLAREWGIFEGEDVIDAWISSISRIGELGLVAPDSVLDRRMRESEAVIFEGAQGILLDADAGFHPFTTWSKCTAANAIDLINEMAPNSGVFQIGVTRSYTVRHGPGPLPTETDVLKSAITEHNQYNNWQGEVRYGWFDAVLARYALGLTGGVDSLAVTHMDLPAHLEAWKYCPGFKGFSGFDDTTIETELSNGLLTSFRLPQVLSLEQRAQFTQALYRVTPELETCSADDRSVIQKIESLVGQRVGFVSHGPRAEDIQILEDIPA